jgi:hypothetical protein
MPSVRRIIPWTRKPPLGYGVNWSNPLAQGLLAFFACNEGGGTPVDLCQGLKLTPNSTAPGIWGQDTYGNGMSYVTTIAGAGASVTTPAHLQLQPPITIVASGTLTGAPATNTILFGVTYKNSFTSPFAGYFLAYYATGNLYNLFFGTGTSTYSNISSGSVSNGPHFVAGTIQSGATSIYVDNPFTAAGTNVSAITSIPYLATSLCCLGVPPFQTTNIAYSLWNYGLIFNRILSTSELNQLYTFGPWGMIAPAKGQRFLPSGLPGGACTVSMPGLVISGYPGTSTAGPSPGAAGLAISGAYGGAVFPGIISPASGLAISGYPGTSTAGPSPGAAGLAITGGIGGTAETVTVLLAGLGLSGAPGGATGGLYIPPPTPFYLPYEYTSVPIETGNANPFGIDPEATTVITTGLTSSD